MVHSHEFVPEQAVGAVGDHRAGRYAEARLRTETRPRAATSRATDKRAAASGTTYWAGALGKML